MAMWKLGFFIVACLLQTQSFAQAQVWTYGQSTDKSGRYANTVNDSDGVFTQRCVPESESCYWSIAILTSCEKDVSTPILGSADSGAGHLTIVCGEAFTYGGKKYYQYYFDSFDSVDKMVRGSKSIGFAMPLASGLFRVVRFDLAGAVSAIDSMRSLAQADVDRKPKKPKTKDLTL